MAADVCPACRSTRIRSAYASAREARYRRCTDCKSVFDAHPPTAEEVRSLYAGPDYFVKGGAAPEGDETLWGYPDDYLADRANIEEKFGRVLGHVERYVTPGRLLDVGCGPGFLLTAAASRGWRPRGLDLNEWAIGHARDELGLDADVGGIEEVSGESEYEAVTMMDLIEHATDAESLVANAARLVREGGCLAILTPDAGSPVSRALGSRWPEVRRPGEHTVLFSVDGLTALLARHGFVASGWHSIGKETTLSTLASDVSPAAPALAERARGWLDGRSAGEAVVDFDPHTKFCLYARRLPPGSRAPAHRPARVPKRPEKLASVESAILDELRALGRAERFCDWMFDQFADRVRGDVAEVGSGIGTFSQRLLDAGAKSLLAIEPEEQCAGILGERFGSDPRVTIARQLLPGSEALREGAFDLVVSQNVLEHIGDDEGALAEMAAALRPGGSLALVVPASPRLFGALDDAYGHWRRYTPSGLAELVESTGLVVEEARGVNMLGTAGWWAKNRRPGARIGEGSLRAYEAMVRLWRPLEDRARPGWGLSALCIARRP